MVKLEEIRVEHFVSQHSQLPPLVVPSLPGQALRGLNLSFRGGAFIVSQLELSEHVRVRSMQMVLGPSLLAGIHLVESLCPTGASFVRPGKVVFSHLLRRIGYVRDGMVYPMSLVQIVQVVLSAIQHSLVASL